MSWFMTVDFGSVVNDIKVLSVVLIDANSTWISAVASRRCKVCSHFFVFDGDRKAKLSVSKLRLFTWVRSVNGHQKYAKRLFPPADWDWNVRWLCPPENWDYSYVHKQRWPDGVTVECECSHSFMNPGVPRYGIMTVESSANTCA